MTTEEIERELREMRPEPDPDFARRLDEWAAADFPPGAGLGSQTDRARQRVGGGSLRRTWDRIRSTPPRRFVLPVGAAATALVIVGVVVSQNGDGSGSLASRSSSDSSGEESSLSAGIQKETTTADSAASAGAGSSAESTPVAPEEGLAAIPDSSANGVARGTDTRLVDATARLSLGTEASKVQDVANQVVDVTDGHDGIVLDSRVTTDQGGARANFSLEIPYNQLDAAIADLSGLADVISRTQGGTDITAKAVHARRDLAAALEQIRKTRIALIEADTRQERLVLKSQLNSLNASADAYKTQLKGVERQAHFATVDVEISSKDSDSGSGGGWSLDDAFHDAGRVLEVIGGMGLVTLAVLLPISIIALLGWAIGTRTMKRRREAVLN